MKAANDAANSSAGRFAQGVSNAFGKVKANLSNFSYQMQDIAVQLGSGQSPLVVLMQQGPQIASIFGPAGAVVGAVGAGLGLLAGYFLSSSKEAEGAKEKAYEFGDALDWLGKVASTTSSQIGDLIDKYRQAGEGARQLTKLELERKQRELEGQVAAAREQAGAAVGGLPIEQWRASVAGPAISFASPPDPEVAAQLDAMRSALDSIDRFQAGGSLNDLLGEINSLAGKSGPDFSAVFRQMSDELLKTAGNAAELEAQLGKVKQELGAVSSVDQGIPYPLAKPDVPGEKPPRAGRKAKAGLSEFDRAQLEGSRLGDFQTDLQAEIDATRQRIIQRNQLEQKGLQERNDLRLQAERESMAELAKYDEEQARIQAQRAPIMDQIEGARSKFKELADESQEYGRLIGQSIQLAADTGAKALSAFILEGKSGLKDLAKTAADQLLTGGFSFLINALVGTGGTALMNAFAPAATPLVTPGNTGSSPLTYGGPHARGGSVRDDRWYWVGENGPERFVPHTAGSIVPANAAGGGGTVVQVIDQRRGSAPAVETQRSRGPNGMEQIKLVIRDTVAEMGQDGGLDKAMRGRYGQRPVPKR